LLEGLGFHHPANAGSTWGLLYVCFAVDLDVNALADLLDKNLFPRFFF
jgi:hypothetical protein